MDIDGLVLTFTPPAGWHCLRCDGSKPVEPEPVSTGVGTGPPASVGPPAIPRLIPTCGRTVSLDSKEETTLSSKHQHKSINRLVLTGISIIAAGLSAVPATADERELEEVIIKATLMDSDISRISATTLTDEDVEARGAAHFEDLLRSSQIFLPHRARHASDSSKSGYW